MMGTTTEVEGFFTPAAGAAPFPLALGKARRPGIAAGAAFTTLMAKHSETT